jgi:hypothetical protein
LPSLFCSTLIFTLFCFPQDLKRAKKQKMKEIIEAMETFNSNLQNSRRLVKKLERDR